MEHLPNHDSSSKGTSNSRERRPLPGTLHLRQRHLFGRMLIAVGIVVGLVGALEMLIVFPLGEKEAESYFLKLPEFLQIIIAAIPEGTPILVLALPGGLMFMACLALVKQGRRHLVPVYDSSEPHIFREPILYLRPFVADESPAQFVRSLSRVLFPLLNKRDRTWNRLEIVERITRYEELLAFAFRQIGTFVAIGAPKEALPKLGAARIYTAMPDPAGSEDEEIWKIEVERQMAGARLILLHIGESEGIKWEIKRVIQLADPKRLVLCVNPPRKLRPGLRNLYNKAFRAEIQDLWGQFRNTCGAFFPHGLPEVIGDARFVRFDLEWTASLVQPTKRKLAWFIPGRPTDLSRKTIESALAWLTWMMIPESFGRKLVRNLINYITFIISFFVVIILLVFGIAAIMDAFR